MNAEWLESIIDLSFIVRVSNFDDPTNDQPRTTSNTKVEYSKHVVTIDMLDKIVEDMLKTDMTDKDAMSRIENLFISYKSLLRRGGLSWVTQDTEKVVVYEVLSAIRPKLLQKRLESDRELLQFEVGKHSIYETLWSILTLGQWITKETSNSLKEEWGRIST